MTENPPRSGARTGERIAKLLARAGVASRREVERMIAEGRVRLGDVVVETPATVLPNLRGVTVDGRAVRAAEPTRLFLFHKPSGLITAERDPNGKPTIYTALRNALPKGTPRVMPVGRLDLNTEGLLLLTNDGELKRALELPASGVPRTYRARTFGDITQAQLEELIEGIEIGGIRYGAIDANMERRTGRNQWIELTLAEGKNREVRRVLEHLGLEVSRLLRTAYGPFHLGDLQRGSAWEVPQKTVEVFRKVLLEGGKALAPVFAPPFDAPVKQAPRPAAREPERAQGRPDSREKRKAGPPGKVARTGPAGGKAPEAGAPTGRRGRTAVSAEAAGRVARPRGRADDDAGELLGRSELRGRSLAGKGLRGRHHTQTPSSEEEGAYKGRRREVSPSPLQRRGPGGGASPARPRGPGKPKGPRR